MIAYSEKSQHEKYLGTLPCTPMFHYPAPTTADICIFNWIVTAYTLPAPFLLFHIIIEVN